MSNYVALVSVRGPIRTASVSELHFIVNDSSVKVEIANLLAHENGGWFEKGVRLTLTMTASNLDEAVTITEITADLVVPLLAVCAAAETPHVHVEIVYEDTPGSGGGELIRYVNVTLPELVLRKIYLHHLEPLFMGLASADARTSDRVIRALWWYQRSLEQRDPVYRFSFLWTALETLNPLLTEKWDLEANPRLCPNCKADLGKLPGVYGIDKLLSEIPERLNDLFRRARNLRNQIVHGGKGPLEIRGEAVALLPAMEAAIPRGVARLFNLSSEKEDSLARAPLAPRRLFSASARMRYERTPDADLGLPGLYPHLNVQVETRVAFDEHGEPTEVEFKGSLRLFCSSDFVPKEIDLFVHLRGRNLPIAVGNLEQHLEVQPSPANRGHGVTLWEKAGREYVWRPEFPKRLE